METVLQRSAIWAVCASVVGCRLFLPMPDLRTPADHARELETKCKSTLADDTAPVFSASVIESVEPAYSHVSSGPGDREARLRGARIHVRPLPGLSRESLQRDLECHEARVTLGTAQAVADDPYVLPDRWLDIDVDSEGDGFVALVRVDAFEDARAVLARARRFVHPQAPPQ